MVLAGVTERQQQLSLVQHPGWSGTDGGLGRPVRAQTTAERCLGGAQGQVRPGRRADWAGRCQSNEIEAARRPAAAKSASPARRI